MIASNYIKKIPDFQDESLKVYARLWQFEIWLRRMVYVELRAKRGNDWKQGLKSVSEAYTDDKVLIHMETSEENDFSFAQLWQMLNLIDINWDCFEKYFPPKKIWKAKAHEISQIRNRIAHFRTGHSDDLRRVEQFLKDIDQGFWKFCTSYNDLHPALPQSSDSVTEHFLHLDPLPWGEIKPKEWARVGQVDRSLVVGIQINRTFRPWFVSESQDNEGIGIFYDISFLSFDRVFNNSRFLENTKHLHQNLVTINFDNQNRIIRTVIPAVLGSEEVIGLIEQMENRARNCVTSSSFRNDMNVASKWPEYVLSNDDPMTFLGDDMPCSFFNV